MNLRAIKTTLAGACGLAAAWLALGLGPAAGAEPPPEAPRIASYVRSGRLRFDLVLGRIRCSTTRFGSSHSRSSSNDRSEELITRATGNGITLTYTLTTSTETFSIQVNAESYLRIRRVPKGSSAVTTLDFVQAAGKPLSLTVGAETEQQVYEAASLWHFLLAEPEVSRRHLVPLLRVLRPKADPLKMAAEVERELLRLAAAQTMPDRQRWAALVEQLGDDRYARRQAADRKLREAGQAVVAFLRNLDASKLDTEQKFRVYRIIQSFVVNRDDDTVQTAAEWLSADAGVWLVLLGRDQESTRRAAAGRLELLLGEPIAFDPGTDAATRQRQIEQIRAKLPRQ